LKLILYKNTGAVAQKICLFTHCYLFIECVFVIYVENTGHFRGKTGIPTEKGKNTKKKSKYDK
jgi:hypothetical protein